MGKAVPNEARFVYQNSDLIRDIDNRTRPQLFKDENLADDLSYHSNEFIDKPTNNQQPTLNNRFVILEPKLISPIRSNTNEIRTITEHSTIPLTNINQSIISSTDGDANSNQFINSLVSFSF